MELSINLPEEEIASSTKRTIGRRTDHPRWSRLRAHSHPDGQGAKPVGRYIWVTGSRYHPWPELWLRTLSQHGEHRTTRRRVSR